LKIIIQKRDFSMTIKKKLFRLFLAFGILLTLNIGPLHAGSHVTFTLLEDTAPIWRNPGKGWVFYGKKLSLSPREVAKGNLLYARFKWSDIQPSENTYNWDMIDNAIAEAKSHGIKFAFGVMNCYKHSLPQWVTDSGARTYIVTPNANSDGIERIPYWSNNPVFFAKLNRFIFALGQRYNGNPDIEFVDIRSYGMWGEGHLGKISLTDSGEHIDNISVDELKSNYHTPYIKAFPETTLIVPWGIPAHIPAYQWDVQQGLGMRRDGIPNYNNGGDITFDHGYGPAIIEYGEGYKEMIAAGQWDDTLVSDDILRAKASYAQIGYPPSLFLTQEKEFIENLANKIGYHFVLKQVSVPTPFFKAKQIPITMSWVNKGITYLYKDCYVAVALLDDNDAVIEKSWLTDVTPKESWAPGSIAVTSKAAFHSAEPGTYKFAVGLFTRTDLAQPDYKIGNQGRTSTGWTVITNSVDLIGSPPARPKRL
jgi:hypothetical protein